jgi:hypothetical protein
MYATLRGNSDVVLTLIGHGATINDENDDGDTVLAIACKCQQRDIVEYLLGYGAKPTRKEATILMENNNLEILQLFVSVIVSSSALDTSVLWALFIRVVWCVDVGPCHGRKCVSGAGSARGHVSKCNCVLEVSVSHWKATR